MNKIGVSRRITITIILVAIVSASFSGFLTLYISRKQFASYIDQSGQMMGQKYSQVIEKYYMTTGSLEGIQTLIIGYMVKMPPVKSGKNWRKINAGRRVIVLDKNGGIVADSERIPSGKENDINKKDMLEFALFTGDKEQIGTLYISSPLKRGISSLENDFVSNISTKIYLSIVLVTLMALFLGIILARRISRPLAALSTAIHEVASGNLEIRVEADGDKEFALLAEDFNLMSRKLMEHEQSRNSLVSNIAHELRTPLSILRGQLEAVQIGSLIMNEEISSSLVDEVIRLTRLVKDLENVGLAESGALKLNIENIEINEIIGHLLPLRLAMEEEKIDFQLDLPEQKTYIRVDINRLIQVLINLLSNAMRHTDENGNISLKIEQNQNETVFAIKDNGSGIAEKDLNHIFERFYRVDESRTRQEGGTGLGLAIARTYVKAHDGKIWAESQPGQGATFYFSLPRV